MHVAVQSSQQINIPGVSMRTSECSAFSFRLTRISTEGELSYCDDDGFAGPHAGGGYTRNTILGVHVCIVDHWLHPI